MKFLLGLILGAILGSTLVAGHIFSEKYFAITVFTSVVSLIAFVGFLFVDDTI